MDEQQGSFKVTDRRLFNPDGSPRELTPEEKKESELKAENTSTAHTSTTEPTGDLNSKAQTPPPDEEEFEESEIPDAHNPASFVNFAMSIASNAASALGMMEHPVTHQREVDLELGKHWIDVLGMLQHKTNGNLSAPEAKILESWLADLRMQYVSLSSSSAAKSAGGFTGRDIIGGN